MFYSSERSQNALNIRPAPVKSFSREGPYEWCKYDYNFLGIQCPELKSLLPLLIYKSLCDWSTQNVHYVPPALSKGCLAYHFPNCSASNIWFCEPYPHRIEIIRPNLYLSTDESFGLAKWQDQIPWRIFRTALNIGYTHIGYTHCIA